MAIGDIPSVPRQYYPRFQALIKQVRDGDIALDKVRTNILTTLGRVKINQDGIKAQGDFGTLVLDSEGLGAILDTIKTAAEAWPIFKGRELLLKKDGKVMKYRIGFPVKKTKASHADLVNPALPMVEFIEKPPIKEKRPSIGFLAYIIEDEEGGGDNMSSGPVKIHRLEEMAGWMGEGWENFSRLLGIGIPALPLTRKRVLDRLNESVPAFWDKVLTKCGV